MANGLLGDPTALRGLLQSPSTTDFALAMLANSGYSSRRRSLGEIVGASMLQSRQMAAEQAQQKLREEYMQAQIAAMQQRQEPQRRIIRGPDGLDYYEDGTRVLPNVQAPIAPPKPRETRTVNVGDQERTEEFNPATGKWEVVATARRWAPQTPTAVINNYPNAATGPQLGPLPSSYMRPMPGQPGMVPEPGSPVALEQAAAEEKAEAARQQRLAKAQSVTSVIDSALAKVSSVTAGAGGSLFRFVPGSSATDLAADLETIEANLSFDELATMRAQSQTGGALGSIAVRELDLLGATVRNLKQRQSPQQLENNLKAVRYHYDRWQMAMNGQDPDKAGLGPRDPGMSAAEKKKLADQLIGVR